MTKAYKRIIVIVALCIATTGCSEQYRMERMVYQADRAAEPIFINKGVVSTYEFNKAVSLYEKIIARKPDSPYAITSQFKIAELYAAQKSFDMARQIYDSLIKTHSGKHGLIVLAMFAKAQSYENAGDWAGALKVFRQILNDYPLSEQGLSIPLYIAQYYVKKKDNVSASQAYNAAIAQYKKIAGENPNTKLAVVCENLIVRAYMEQGYWEKAVQYIESLESKYKLGPDTLLTLAKIYANKLSEPQKAKEIYEKILKDFPKGKGAEAVKEEIKKLSKTQTKNDKH